MVIHMAFDTAIMQSNRQSQLVTQTTWQSWLVCFSAASFFFYEFIQMHMFNAISSSLLMEFKINAWQLSLTSSIYFYSNVIFLFPAGIILDSLSTRKVIISSLSVCIIGTLGFAFAHSLVFAGICRFLTAIGGAFCFLSCVKLASRWFPAHRLALIMGLVVTMAMLGGMVAQTPLTLLVNAIGWRKALLVDAGLGVIILGIIFSLVQDYPNNFHDHDPLARGHIKQFGYWQSMRIAFLRLGNWICGIYTCLLNLPIYLLGGLWGIQYLQIAQGLSAATASIVTSVLFLGTIIGSPVMGWLSDRLALRRLPMILGAISSLIIIMVIILPSHLSLENLVLLFFLLGFFTSSQIISYPTVAESNPSALTATAVSVVSISVLSGGAIFEPVFGWLLSWHWHGIMQNGAPIYTRADFQFAMWIFPTTLLFGLIASFFVKETRGRRSE